MKNITVPFPKTTTKIQNKVLSAADKYKLDVEIKGSKLKIKGEADNIVKFLTAEVGWSTRDIQKSQPSLFKNLDKVTLKESKLSKKVQKKHDAMRAFVFDKLENSDIESDKLQKEFIKKFGKGYEAMYDDFLTDFMG